MTKQRRFARIRALGRALPAVLIAAILVAGPQALAQAAGGVEGKVVHGAEETPVADVAVTLRLFAAESDLGTLSTTTDARGRYAFDGLPDDTAGYQVVATYGGVEFHTVAAAYTPGQTVQQDVTVWEPTDDPADVTLTDYVVWVDREGDGVAVQHDLTWDNAGDLAYVGQGGEVVSVPLPQGAVNLQYLGTFLESPGDVQGQRYVSDAPIVPGSTAATLRYSAPPLSELTLEMTFPTTSVQLFVPQDVDVQTTQLRLAGTISDQGIAYNVYAAQDVAAGSEFQVTMSEVQASGSSSAIAWILAGVAALVAVVLLTAWLTGRRRRTSARPRSAKGRAPARAPARARKVTTAPGANGDRVRETAPSLATGNGKREGGDVEDVDLIVDEIAALDLSFERNLLDERTYKRLRVAAKDRLLRAEGARARDGRTR
jgi:hypothetical protein